MKKTLDTEEIVISSLLLLCGAIATVTRYILIPAVCLILALLGWRPPAKAAPTSISRMELEEAALFPALLPTAGRSSRLEPMPAERLRTANRLISAADWVGQWQPNAPRWKRVNTARDLEAQDAIVDPWSDYSSEVPTAEDRSPSLRKRNR